MNRPITPPDHALIDAATLIAAPPEGPFNAASPAIFQTSLFTFDAYSDLEDVFAGRSRQFIYSRGDNPTVMEFERLIASLEGAEAARAFSSGTGAIAATLMAFLEAGDRIVAVEHLYSDAYRICEKLLKKFGVAVDYVDGSDTEAVKAALPGAKLLYLESPTSLVFELQDVPALAAEARRLGVLTVMDNSWATPLHQKPLAHGVDLVIHAASKYLGGHSDTVGGVVAGAENLIARVNGGAFPYLGAKLSPFEAWLLLRGMRTLPLRIARHMQSGLDLAERLRAHSDVATVRHPAFSAHRGRETLTGFGGLFAFEVTDEIDVPRFVDALGHVRIGVSWGGPESLVMPALAPLQMAEVNSLRRFGVSPRAIRFSVGLENPDVIWSDVEQALGRARR
ncbi:PLP-dependent transferase [Methylopila sp. M107]|uniref:PLP-dependent transferase n=1 Tax=Methylopila sp. M107 TaxID=1101190 RepID=UPI000370F394|nr:PLP-dependent transferase [Methylopila sp. M107]